MSNSNKKQFIIAVAGTLLVSAAVEALASGYALNEQSVSSMGTAYAGRSASALDASTVYSNPAGMSYLSEAELVGGLSLIHASTDISDASACQPKVSIDGLFDSCSGATLSDVVNGTNDGDMVPTSFVPFGYYVMPVDDRLSAGFGIYAPSGVSAEYEASYMGRYFARTSDLKAVNFQPTVSYKINRDLSVGGGVYASYVTGTLSQAINPLSLDGKADIFQIPESVTYKGDGYGEVQGNAWGFGYNVGTIYQVTEPLRLGVTYHSKVDYSLTGDYTVIYPDYESSPGDIGPGGEVAQNAVLDVSTPDSVDLGLAYELDKRWTLLTGATWTHWSLFEELVVEQEEGGEVISYVPEFWEDTWSYGLGASYQLDRRWTLRAGYAYDPSPVPDDHVTARLPLGDRNIFSFGTQYRMTRDMDIDLAFTYILEDEVTVNDELLTGPDEPIPQFLYTGKYNNSAVLLGAQFTYRL